MVVRSMFHFRHSAIRFGLRKAIRRCKGTIRRESPKDYVAAITGLVAGTTGGLCGVGGGIVIMPMLTMFSKLTPHVIVGTSLLTVSKDRSLSLLFGFLSTHPTQVSTAAAFGAVSYFEQNIGDLSKALVMFVSATSTSYLGVYTNNKISGGILKQIMASSLILAVPLVLMKTTTEIPNVCTKNKKPIYHEMRDVLSNTTLFEFLKQHSDYIAVGLISGFTAGLLGIGGGIISTTYMASFTEMTQIDAVATSLFALVPTGLYTSFWQLKAGNVNLRAAGVMAVFCAGGMIFATRCLAPNMDDATMRKIFAGFLFVSGVRMFR